MLESPSGMGPSLEPVTPPLPWGTQDHGLPLTPPAAPRFRLAMLVGVGVGAALLAAALTAVIVVRMVGPSGATHTGAAATASVQLTTGPTPAFAPDSAIPTVDTTIQQRAFLSKVDGILQQSAQARAEVINVVAGVKNACSVPPETASRMIDRVIVNRRSVLAQARVLDPSSVAGATDIRRALVDALTASISADTQYEQWLDYLYTRYFDAYPIGCPFGAVPIDGHYWAANQASFAADAAKQAFVAMYNPVASQFGLRQWADTDF